MQRMLIRFFFFWFLFSNLLLGKDVKAQGTIPSLRVSQLINFPSVPDTIYEGVAYDSIGIVVKNDGTVPYQGSISVAMRADSSIFPVYLSFNPSGVFLLPGDSIIYFVSNYFFDPATFREGDNIVVVWPVANVNVSDTLETDAYYVHITGLNELYSPAELDIWPNPASGELNIFTAPDIHLEQVRVYGIDGRIVGEYNIKSARTIYVNQFSPGIYYIYFYHRNGITVRKLLRQ